MPTLQIDGNAIAEIEQGKATELLAAAAVGIGQVRRPAGVGMGLPKPVGWILSIKLIVDFPEQQIVDEKR
jgi:hypothetical protein